MKKLIDWYKKTSKLLLFGIPALVLIFSIIIYAGITKELKSDRLDQLILHTKIGDNINAFEPFSDNLRVSFANKDWKQYRIYSNYVCTCINTDPQGRILSIYIER